MIRLFIFLAIVWHVVGITHLHCDHANHEKHTTACLHYLNYGFYKKDILFVETHTDDILKLLNLICSYLQLIETDQIIIENGLNFLSEIITRGPPTL